MFNGICGVEAMLYLPSQFYDIAPFARCMKVPILCIFTVSFCSCGNCQMQAPHPLSTMSRIQHLHLDLLLFFILFNFLPLPQRLWPQRRHSSRWHRPPEPCLNPQHPSAVVTHLGNIIKAGDICAGYDLTCAQFNDEALESYQGLQLPEVILVKKGAGPHQICLSYPEPNQTS